MRVTTARSHDATPTRGAIHLLLLLVPFFLLGCATSNMTNPPRSATEQLLLSTAADRAIAGMHLAELNGKRVFVDTNYLDGYDYKYALGAIRDACSRSGGLLVGAVTNSEIVVEPRSGALSTDSNDSIIGIPQTAVPIPFAGTITLPELAIYKNARQNSIAKLALLIYETDSGQHVYSTGPAVGRAYNRYYKLLSFITWTRTDIPEKQEKK